MKFFYQNVTWAQFNRLVLINYISCCLTSSFYIRNSLKILTWKLLLIVLWVLQPLKPSCFYPWHAHSVLTGRGCRCSSWECRRESYPWNRRYRRSPGCSAPAATTAGLPQSLASLSSHWCLWKNQTRQKDISLFHSLPLLLLCILMVHASLLNRLWASVPGTGEQHPQNHCSGPAACCAGSLPRNPNPFTICPSLAHAHPSSCFKRTEKRVLQ